VINGPSSANFDVDLGPWILSDWYHADVFGLDWIGLVTPLGAIPDSTLLNGKGIFNCNPANDTRCTGDNEYYEVDFIKTKSYKFTLINTGTILTYTFWIDGHNLTVIQTDFVPINPYTVDILNVGIGKIHNV
jgi:FtsP/CotA-like multicopper oxidase with cupredoxin domain